MKLFMHENRLFLILQVLQFNAFFFILWLDGYRNTKTVLYAIFIGIFLMGIYLIYRYVTQRSFYRRLSRGFESLDESLQRMGNTPMTESLDELLDRKSTRLNSSHVSISYAV